MFLKMMGAMPRYIYSERDDGVAVNLFVGSRASMRVAGTDVSIRQTTNYPWDGKVELTLGVASPSEFALRVRVPRWRQSVQISVNGETIASPSMERGYAVLSRRWSEGDKVLLDLPLAPRFVNANRQVAANRGRVAIQRGPLIYCLEGCDNDDLLRHLYVSQDAALRVESRADLLRGVEVVRCQARLRGEAKLDSDGLSENTDETRQAVAIPFFAHSNRGATTRCVWVPEQRSLAEVMKTPTIASEATWTASHVWPGDTVAALNDQLDITASDDQTIPRFTWWDKRGTTEWVQADFAEPTEVSEVRVYWWDERRLGAHCRTPAKWRVLSLQDGAWRPIRGQSEGPTDMDRYGAITIPRQTLKAVRIEAELQPKWSAGILEVEIGR